MLKSSIRLFGSSTLITSKRNRSNTPFKIRYAMDFVYFRHVQPDSRQMDINFRYTNQDLGIDREFNFSRVIEETIETCLDRIKANIEKEFSKKTKKKNSPVKQPDTPSPSKENPQVSVELLMKDEKVTKITLADIIKKLDFYNTNEFKLRIDQKHFQVLINTPWVSSLVLPSCILAGYYVYPQKIQLLFSDETATKFKWYRGIMPKSNDVKKIQWESICEDFLYMTTTSDIGYRLKVECIPSKNSKIGPLAECISKLDVQPGPGLCPFENRNMFTTNKLEGNSFRVTSYNLLADLYADSSYTRTVLFPYCPKYVLDIEYRKQLFIKEIINYNSDIICLQEVDLKVFQFDLKKVLGAHNYQGIFKNKGSTTEGLATFFNTKRFELIKEYGVNMSKKMQTYIYSDVFKKISDNEQLVKRLIERSTALQVTLLKSKDNGKTLIICNTHLYFHPDADHIRLLQIGFAMQYIEDIYNNLDKTLSKNDVSLIFCGDFNSVPECGIYKLMTEKFVDEDFIDWRSNAEEAVVGVTLRQPFNMSSACGSSNNTNITDGFKACIDYIFYQNDNLIVEEVIPFPSEEELELNIALPSVVFPSDHIALIANFKWADKKEDN